MGHVAPMPWISDEAAAAINGREVNAETAEAAGEAAVATATPLSNNEYKVQLAKVAVKRVLLRAAGLETGGF
jgi:xanthine dehydrogenase YagS FAD-binding subunit